MVYNQLSVMIGETGVPKEVQMKKNFDKCSEEDENQCCAINISHQTMGCVLGGSPD